MNQSIKNRASSGRPYQPKRHRRRIKLDRVQASDLTGFEFRFCCEDCSHFGSSTKTCTLGYVAQHTKKEQMELYQLTGHMAFCRFLEID
jgi:hypothetical protein